MIEGKHLGKICCRKMLYLSLNLNKNIFTISGRNNRLWHQFHRRVTSQHSWSLARIYLTGHHGESRLNKRAQEVVRNRCSQWRFERLM